MRHLATFLLALGIAMVAFASIGAAGVFNGPDESYFFYGGFGGFILAFVILFIIDAILYRRQRREARGDWPDHG
jgi:hypothetical protein